jgi:DNA mismatch endonuclease (patch repair protein)
MADRISTQARSALMARVLSRRNASTELRLAALFRRFKIRGWRRNQILVGKPDFLFRSERIAVFVDGCFWHGCPTCYRRPEANRLYWDAKVGRNRTRDQHVSRTLRKEGWCVVRVWEHELENDIAALCINRIRRLLDSRQEVTNTI